MKRRIKKWLEQLRVCLRRFLQLPPNYIGDNGCLRAAASFIAWNQVEGDYLEFGVWRGYSFITAYHEIWQQRHNHYQFGYDSPDYNRWKKTKPRFFAFDSFAGLPSGGQEQRMVDYHPGAYACPEDAFLTHLKTHQVDLNDVVTVKGLYGETCNPATKQTHQLNKAALIMIDCDLYESTVPVLDFLTDIVQQGTLIVFDDWFRFKGNPDCGEQRACREWLARNPHIELIEFWRQGPQAVGFLVNIKASSKT